MTYVELDIEDELYEQLQELADEEGVSTEELIIDILKDEISYTADDDVVEDDDEDDYNICSDGSEDFDN